MQNETALLAFTASGFGFYGIAFIVFRKWFSKKATELDVRVTWPWNSPSPGLFLFFGIFGTCASAILFTFLFKQILN